MKNAKTTSFAADGLNKGKDYVYGNSQAAYEAIIILPGLVP